MEDAGKPSLTELLKVHGNKAEYSLKSKIQLDLKIIEPYFIGPGHKITKTIIKHSGVPNAAMIPENESARLICNAWFASLNEGMIGSCHTPKQIGELSNNELFVKDKFCRDKIKADLIKGNKFKKLKKLTVMYNNNSNLDHRSLKLKWQILFTWIYCSLVSLFYKQILRRNYLAPDPKFPKFFPEPRKFFTSRRFFTDHKFFKK